MLRDVRCRLLTVEQARDRYGVVLAGQPLQVDEPGTAELRARMPHPTDWIDRGEPVASPAPGEFRELREAPVPWLVIGQRVADEVLARADD